LAIYNKPVPATIILFMGLSWISYFRGNWLVYCDDSFCWNP
jgi:hypothetical protein